MGDQLVNHRPSQTTHSAGHDNFFSAKVHPNLPRPSVSARV
jgi:hypothetical protein